MHKAYISATPYYRSKPLDTDLLESESPLPLKSMLAASMTLGCRLSYGKDQTLLGARC